MKVYISRSIERHPITPASYRAAVRAETTVEEQALIKRYGRAPLERTIERYFPKKDILQMMSALFSSNGFPVESRDPLLTNHDVDTIVKALTMLPAYWQSAEGFVGDEVLDLSESVVE